VLKLYQLAKYYRTDLAGDPVRPNNGYPAQLKVKYKSPAISKGPIYEYIFLKTLKGAIFVATKNHLQCSHET
jgi:hypothetical protein